MDKKIWSRWLVDYQYMTQENFKSFDEYKQEMKKSETTDKSNKEILEEMLEIEKAYKGG